MKIIKIGGGGCYLLTPLLQRKGERYLISNTLFGGVLWNNESMKMFV